MEQRTPPRMVTLVMLTAASTLSLNMFLPSLVAITRELKADYAVVSLAIGGYLAGTAVLQLVIGSLSDRFGRRPVLLSALVVFTIASLICAMATSVWVFLVFRMLQGVMIAGHAVSMAIVRDTSAPEEAASRIGYIVMSMAVAPMLGPMVGGLVDSAFGWRANFVVYFGIGVMLLALCWWDLGETHKGGDFTLGQQLRSYGGLVRSGRFWAFALCSAFSIGAFFTFLTGAALVAESVFGISTAMLGICIGSITAGFIVGAFLSGRFATRVGLVRMMLIGRTVACLGLVVGLAALAFGDVSIVAYFGATICVGLGNGLTTPSSGAGAMSVRPDLSGSAAGLSGALVVAMGAVLTTVAGNVLTPENVAPMLLSLMLLSSFAGLLAAVWLWWAGEAETNA